MIRTFAAIAAAGLAALASASAQPPKPDGLPGPEEAGQMMRDICYATVRSDHDTDASAQAECTCTTEFYADELPPVDFMRVLQIMKIARELRDAGAFSPDTLLAIAGENGLTPEMVEDLFARVGELDAAEEAKCGILRG